MDDADETAPLQKLASFAPSSSYFVFTGADGLLTAARRLDRQQIALTSGCDEPEHLVVILDQLDQNDALTGPRQVIHFGRLGEQSSGLRGCRNHDFRTTHELDADDFGAFGWTGVPTTGSCADFHKRLDAGWQRVAVAVERKRVGS